jgi:hypothetical protein
MAAALRCGSLKIRNHKGSHRIARLSGSRQPDPAIVAALLSPER